jgi:glycosyltransferase involved in cell wall biosynthesis
VLCCAGAGGRRAGTYAVKVPARPGVAALRAASVHRWWIRRVPAPLRDALPERLRILLRALDVPAPTDAPSLVRATASRLAGARPDELWLALAVLTATLPDQSSVLRAVRTSRLDGPLAALREAFDRVLDAHRDSIGQLGSCAVQVVTDRVVVDVHNTARQDLATGIQRVARETVRRWRRDHDLLLVGWHTERAGLRPLLDFEQQRALHGGMQGRTVDTQDQPVLVPWRCRYVLPELIAELDRVGALQSMFRFSGNQSSIIGFDCVPLTVPETVQAEPVVNGFAGYLAALTHADRVAPISRAAAREYNGWRAMLAGTGLPGPDITPISLPVEAVAPSAEHIEQARRDLTVAGLPMVLVVGSHEPRKNHLAVLHAAELLWRDGLRFHLLFIGGNAWNSHRFVRRVEQLRDGNRPVDLLTALPDEQLWCAYHLARCTLFPSLNEGFGLPVAESLACGTPVITSAFGSMREIAEPGGALLVDPRDDHDVAAALRRLITDDELHTTLSKQARERPARSWDRYAGETWDYLVGGIAPPHAGTLPT